MKPDAPVTRHFHRLPRANVSSSQATSAPPSASVARSTRGSGSIALTSASAGERDIEHEHAHDDFLHGEAVIGRALIEVGAVRLPDRLAPDEAARRA